MVKYQRLRIYKLVASLERSPEIPGGRFSYCTVWE